MSLFRATGKVLHTLNNRFFISFSKFSIFLFSKKAVLIFEIQPFRIASPPFIWRTYSQMAREFSPEVHYISLRFFHKNLIRNNLLIEMEFWQSLSEKFCHIN